jgi:protein tyrosine phosphatase
LQEEGFERILSLLEDSRQYAYDPKAAKGRFAWFNVPMRDHATPDLAQLFEVHGRLQEAPSSPVLVHCYAGIGRTGLVAVSYLMTKGLSKTEAIQRVDAWTGDAFSWEVRSRREAIHRLLQEFLDRWPASPKA